jgi:hypothetical protein
MYYGSTPDSQRLRNIVRETVSESNLFLLETMKDLSGFFEKEKHKENSDFLENYRLKIKTKHEEFRKPIQDTIYQLKRLAERKDWLVKV